MKVAAARQSNDHADVLIIGAGPAGATAAMAYAQAGFTVVCLEQGDWVNSAEYPGGSPDWELQTNRRWHPDPNVRQLDADYPCDVSESDGSPNMYSAVGGSSIIYRAHWPRMLPSDFAVKTLDGVADDWPLSYADLLPYYEVIDEIVGAAGTGGDPAYPPGLPPPLPAHSITPIGRRVALAMNELGWHWWPGTNAIATRKHRSLNPCVHYATCASGCPNESKASFDLIVWPDALRAGARLVTGARVMRVTSDANGLVTGAIYRDRTGRELRQTADVVVLAANAIGNARLLLLSPTNLSPDGLANSSGLVGKRLMTHPYVTVRGVFEETFPSWEGPSGQFIQSLQFYETDVSRGFVRGAKWALLPTGGPLGMALPRLLDDGPKAAVAARRAAFEQLGHSVEWGILAKDLPHDTNRVTLSDTLVDSDGLPGVKILIRDDQNVIANLGFQAKRATESLDVAGAIQTITAPIKKTRSHNIGTTVMGTDPDSSVVDQFGRSHDVPNLFVMGASVFPTSSGMNPTPTICALTLRAVEQAIESKSQQRIAGKI